MALRSCIPRDGIDDVEIVEAEDREVSATRDIVQECEPVDAFFAHTDSPSTGEDRKPEVER